jgi:hypothetical protein
MDTQHKTNISRCLSDCLDNHWLDLVDHLGNITGALIDVPDCGRAMRCELLEWCAEVDHRIETLTRDGGGMGGAHMPSERLDPTQNTDSFFPDSCGDKFGCES